MDTDLIDGALTMIEGKVLIHHNGITTDISSSGCDNTVDTKVLQVGEAALTEEDIKDILKIIKVIKKRDDFAHLFI